MNCAEARDALAANPAAAATDPALAGHLASCPECAAYSSDMRELDIRVRRALEVPVPTFDLPSSLYADVEPAPAIATGSDNVVRLRAPAAGPRARSGAWGRWAMAAGLAAVAIVAGLLSGGYPRESLANAVVGHMAEEPQAWSSSTPVPAHAVAAALRRAGFKADSSLGTVTYLQSCFFRGHYVPHFVVQTGNGPRSVMLLRDEHVGTRTAFDENGYRGVLVPTVEGSIAVLARDSNDVTDAATGITRSIHYVR
jgi:hypothetical protein